MTFAPGVAVGQNLRLVRLMAKGGMGSIWVADHLGLHTQVAVKFIDEALGVDENLLARFAREAVAAAQIRSPHVVQILDHGSIDGRIPAHSPGADVYAAPHSFGTAWPSAFPIMGATVMPKIALDFFLSVQDVP